MNDTVIVDTNLIVNRDWTLCTPWWSLLRGLSATGQIQLVVPELVIREAVGQFHQAVTKPSRALSKLGLGINQDEETERYRTQLRATLSEAEAICPDHEPMSLLEVADRAIERRRPFNEQGNGFRDTVIWAFVLEAASAGGRTVFISGDGCFSRGKAEDRRLHPDLAAEAAGFGNVVWFADLGSYLESTGRGDHHEAEAAVLEIVAGDRGQVEANLALALEGSSATVYGRDRARATIVAVGQPIQNLRTGLLAHPQSDDAFVARIEFDAPIVIDVDVWMGDSGEVHAGVELPTAELEVEAFYDAGDRLLDSFSGGLVELDWDRISDAIALSAPPPTGQIRLSLGQTEALRDVLETFQLSQTATVRKAFADVDFAQLAGLGKVLEGVDFGALESLRKASSTWDFGQSDAIRNLLKGINLPVFDSLRDLQNLFRVDPTWQTSPGQDADIGTVDDDPEPDEQHDEGES